MPHIGRIARFHPIEPDRFRSHDASLRFRSESARCKNDSSRKRDENGRIAVLMAIGGNRTEIGSSRIQIGSDRVAIGRLRAHFGQNRMRSEAFEPYRVPMRKRRRASLPDTGLAIRCCARLGYTARFQCLPVDLT